jgi:hypothetical protein
MAHLHTRIWNEVSRVVLDEHQWKGTLGLIRPWLAEDALEELPFHERFDVRMKGAVAEGTILAGLLQLCVRNEAAVAADDGAERTKGTRN